MAHDDRDEFNAGFTDDEREAGVPDLFRTGRSTHRLPPQNAEVTSTFTRDELIDALLSGLAVSVERQVSVGYNDDWSLRNIAYAFEEQDSNVYAAMGEDTRIPVSLLTDVLRELGIPARDGSNGWLVWDTVDQSFTVVGLSTDTQNVAHYSGFPLAKKAAPGWRLTQENLFNERDRVLYGALVRAASSTDHGMRPLLVRKDMVNALMRREKVEFAAPRKVPSDLIDEYVLAFSDSAGAIATFPLETARERSVPIVTRNGSYSWSGGSLVSDLSTAKMLVSAFLIARGYRPKDFQWYRGRRRGTIFQAAIERVEADEDRFAAAISPWDEVRTVCGAGMPFHMVQHEQTPLGIATKLNELTSGQGSVLIAIGGHPLDVCLVTTPELYLHAVKTLTDFDQKIGGGPTGKSL